MEWKKRLKAIKTTPKCPNVILFCQRSERIKKRAVPFLSKVWAQTFLGRIFKKSHANRTLFFFPTDLSFFFRSIKPIGA